MRMSGNVSGMMKVCLPVVKFWWIMSLLDEIVGKNLWGLMIMAWFWSLKCDIGDIDVCSSDI